MASVNKVIIVGNLGADPETRYTSGGDAVCNIRVATTDKWKDKNSGEQKERTEWHTIVLYGRLGEIADEYLSKGSQVYIEGKLFTQKWQDNDGNDRYATKIQALSLQLLGSRDDGGGKGGKGGKRSRDDRDDQDYDPPPRESRSDRQPSNRPKPNFEDLGDDIPF